MNGRNINHIIIGLYYHACTTQGIPKTFTEVAKIFKCLVKDLTGRRVKKYYNKIKNKIGSCIKNSEDIIKAEKELIGRYFSENKYKHKMLAFQIIDNIHSHGLLDGKSTKTVAGIAVYLSYQFFKEKLKDYNMFSKEATVKKALDEIKDYHNIIVPQNFNIS